MLLTILWYLSSSAVERLLTGLYFLMRYLPAFLGWIGFALGVFWLYASGHYNDPPKVMFKEHWWLMPFFWQALMYFIGRMIVWVLTYAIFLLPVFVGAILYGIWKIGI